MIDEACACGIWREGKGDSEGGDECDVGVQVWDCRVGIACSKGRVMSVWG
jgi:hypothetical protein